MMTPENDNARAGEVEAFTRLLESWPTAVGPSVIYLGVHDAPALLGVLGLVGRLDGKLLAVRCLDARGRAGGVPLDDLRRQARAAGLSRVLTLVEGHAPDVVRAVAPGHADMLFIHAAPGYSEVREQVLDWYPTLRHGGVLVGDGCHEDPGQLSLAEAVAGGEEPAGDGPHPGVTRLVGELFPDAERLGRVWVAFKGRGRDALLEATLAMRRHTRERARAELRLLAEVTDVSELGRATAEPAEALAIYEQLTREFPGYERGFTELAGRLAELGLTDQVIALYKEALDRGGNPIFYTELARALAVKGDAGAVETYCKAALRMTPDHMPAWLTLIECHFGEGDVERGTEALVLALRAAPPDADVLGVLGRMSIISRSAKAMRIAAESLEMVNPGDPLIAAIAGALAGER